MSYEDIINLPHHVSATRKHMSLHDRAAQFSPFAALTGYGDEINETARLTDEKLDTSADEEKLERLNRTMQYLLDSADTHPHISITFFMADSKKDGGKYITEEGDFKKIDEAEMCICLTNGKRYYKSDIYDIRIQSICQ